MARTPADRGSQPTYDSTVAAAAWESFSPRVAALAPEAVALTPADPRAGAITALTVAEALKDPAVRGRFTRLHREDFDPATLDDLATGAWALWYARTHHDAAAASQVEVALPEDFAQRAADLRGRMMKVVTHYFEDDPALAAEVKSLGRRKGHGHLASDLARLAAIYTAQHAVVERDPKYYRPTDVDEARTLAADIQKRLADARTDAEAVWADRVARAWTVLSGIYDEVHAAGSFLYRHENPGERFPVNLGQRRPRGRP